MQRISKEASGHFLHWPLADALVWRMQWRCSPKDAFRELAKLCLEGRVQAVGVYVESNPERPTGWDFPMYREWIDPPVSPAIRRSGCDFGLIPAAHWSDFCPVLDDDGRPTSGLDYASVRLPAWRIVEFEKVRLVKAWLPEIPKQANTPDVAAHNKAKLGIPKRRRGPQPVLKDGIAQKMMDDLTSGKFTPEQLRSWTLLALSKTYGGSPGTAKNARDTALIQFSELQN